MALIPEVISTYCDVLLSYASHLTARRFRATVALRVIPPVTHYSFRQVPFRVPKTIRNKKDHSEQVAHNDASCSNWSMKKFDKSTVKSTISNALRKCPEGIFCLGGIRNWLLGLEICRRADCLKNKCFISIHEPWT